MDKIIVRLPGHGLSNSAAGRCKHWIKKLTGVDTTKDTGYAFTGQFTQFHATEEVPPGTWYLSFVEDRAGSGRLRGRDVTLYEARKDDAGQPVVAEVESWSLDSSAGWTLKVRDEIARLIAPDKTSHYRASFFLTQDLEVTFSVFDHHTSEVPDEAWQEFVDSYRQAHGTEPTEVTLTKYVVQGSAWSWDECYSNGSVAIGDADGPFMLETEPVGPEGCRIMFWPDGTTGYDTGLRVWDPEAQIIARMLQEKAASEATPA